MNDNIGVGTSESISLSAKSYMGDVRDVVGFESHSKIPILISNRRKEFALHNFRQPDNNATDELEL